MTRHLLNRVSALPALLWADLCQRHQISQGPSLSDQTSLALEAASDTQI